MSASVFFSVIFDNGGGTTVQTDDGFAHHYDRPEQAAEDVKVLLDGGDTVGWDGNESDARMEYDIETERNGGYRWHDEQHVRRIVERSTLSQHDRDGGFTAWGWRNAEAFYETLGVNIAE